MNQPYIVLDIVHSIHGRFQQIRMTPRSLKVCAGSLALFAVLGIGLVGVCIHLVFKNKTLEAVQADYRRLQQRYRDLQTVSSERKEAVSSLANLATQVSAEYGIVRPTGDVPLDSDDADSPEAKESIKQFNFLKEANYSGIYQRYAHQWHTHTEPSSWPVQGVLRSSFGGRTDPLSGEGAFHTGIDLSAATGTPVHVTADGVVVSAGWHRQYGNLVVVDHGNGYQTYYAHLSQFLVVPGEDVRQGQEIALSGGTGRVTSPHLHYEVRIQGVPVNPYRFLSQRPEIARVPVKAHSDLGL